MERESSLLYAQVPNTWSYPETNPSSPHTPFSPPEDPSLCYRPIYVFVSPVVSFNQISLSKTLCTPLSSSIRATCPAHLILLDFITRTILGEEYRSFSSLLCNFLHSSVTLKPFRHKYSPQHPVPKHPQPMFLPQYGL